MTLSGLLLLASCTGAYDVTLETNEAEVIEAPVVPDVPEVCDAGHDAWVMRAMPLMWGRKPHGAGEVRLWSQMADEHGREAVVHAMTLDPEYRAHWRDWFTDALYVARVGDKHYGPCFRNPRFDSHDGSITAHLVANDPGVAYPGAAFNMADVILDGLVADDVSVIYQAHLLARMNRPVQGANVSLEELEFNRRVNFGEVFFNTYLGRNLNCMPCHNSEFSTTDNADPALDRTWQLPGSFERALFELSSGRSADETYSVFRYNGLVREFGGGDPPWGMRRACGAFGNPNNLPQADFIDQNVSYFIEHLGSTGSAFSLERRFAQGVRDLKAQGLVVGEDGTVSGTQAFAYLVATNVADQVWAEATGSRLTIAFHFPRTEAQSTRLKHLADTFAAGFSLRSLLTEVLTDDYFNAGLRASCRAADYGLEPVFNPWTDSEEVEKRKNNSAGDAAHRLSARAMLRSAHANLGWASRSTWLGVFDYDVNDEAFFEAIGVFQRESSPGHDGSDLQAALAWDREYGTCRAGLESGDIVDQLVGEAVTQGATGAELAHAIKDRLTSQDLDWTETEMVAEFLGVQPDAPVEASAELLRRSRLYCGVLLLSPQFQMVTDQEVGTVPRLALGLNEDCERVALRMSDAGYLTQCSEGQLRGAP